MSHVSARRVVAVLCVSQRMRMHMPSKHPASAHARRHGILTSFACAAAAAWASTTREGMDVDAGMNGSFMVRVATGSQQSQQQLRHSRCCVPPR